MGFSLHSAPPRKAIRRGRTHICHHAQKQKVPKGAQSWTVGTGRDEHLRVAPSSSQDLGGSTWGWRQYGSWLRLCF